MTLWKGRFEKPMNPTMAKISQSLSTDLRLLPYEIELDRVYAVVLSKIDILDDKEVEKIYGALEAILKEYESGAYNASEFPDEDVHSLIERRLIALAGSAGAKIHTGRSRNDLVMTDVRLYLRDECLHMRAQIGELARALIAKAEEHQGVVMPGYTHLQRAQPVALSHYLCSFGFSLMEDAKRIGRVMAGQISLLPLGAGALAGSAFPIDREWVARKLGFEGVTDNSIQTVSNRDEFLEMASALSIIMIHLSRYAEDFIIWSTSEFGFVELDDSVSTGSSMMPQKKNPDSLELIRGKAARVIGAQQTLLTLMKGLPLTYARDLQEDKPALFDIIEQTKISISMFEKVIIGMRFNADAMRAALSVDLVATDFADYLVKKGVPFRDTHELVARLFQGNKKRELTLDDLKSASHLFGDDAAGLLDPEKAVSLRAVSGGTSPDSVKVQLKNLRRFFQS